MSNAQAASDKQRIAHTLRLAGMSWSEVAGHMHEGSQLYASAGAAYTAAKKYRDQHDYGDDLMEQRATEMERYDALQRAMWRKALAGDLAAAKFCLSVMVAREKLLGAQGLTPRDTAHDPIDELAKKREAS